MTTASMSKRSGCSLGMALLMTLLASFMQVHSAVANEPLRLNIIGGLGGVNQFTRFEEPFWRNEIAEITGGRVIATVHPFDRSGFPGADMLDLMQTGVVGFGTALLALAAGDDPELNGIDQPGLNPDFGTLRRLTSLYRPHLKSILQERYNVELLGIYTYPQQVLFCARPISSLKDLQGLRVRTSSVSQSEMMTAVGAMPVKMAFAEVVGGVRRGVVDCAITGTLSGNEIGLIDVASHIHPMAINAGISIFGVNRDLWGSLPPELQETLRKAVTTLESRIWDAAERETVNGLACNIGAESCQGARKGSMTMVPVTQRDAADFRRLFVEHVFPSWLKRCGEPCRVAWNRYVGPELGMMVEDDNRILIRRVSDTANQR
ncbi:MAG: TRAP transporter substrate-binding protein [Beijerinckiaceae bacterium]|jgi:TRAP-type C4-dicarboxylate transport system substrate-binding protein|nr:TRAP transporter substrate-binding protein [Beijerinckiaceae bacterium]